MSKIKVENVEISVIKVGGEDYISLTDMVREVENGSALIEKWLRNKNTIEFLGIWEEMYNPDFNSPEFGGIMENITAVMIYDGIPQPKRLKRLNEIAIHQMRVLSETDNRNLLK